MVFEDKEKVFVDVPYQSCYVALNFISKMGDSVLLRTFCGIRNKPFTWRISRIPSFKTLDRYMREYDYFSTLDSSKNELML